MLCAVSGLVGEMETQGAGKHGEDTGFLGLLEEVHAESETERHDERVQRGYDSCNSAREDRQDQSANRKPRFFRLANEQSERGHQVHGQLGAEYRIDLRGLARGRPQAQGAVDRRDQIEVI